MSMILGLSTISDENLARIFADPPLVWRVIAQDEPDLYEAAVAEAHSTQGSIWQRWFGKKSGYRAPSETLRLVEGEVEETDLDKSWHGIHFMLTQTAWEGSAPLNFIICGGREIGNIDVGYGPARGMTAAEVRVVAEALRRVDEAFMRSRFDPARMLELEIYPTIWDRDADDHDVLGYCLEYLAVLKEFIARAAARGVGLIITLT